MTDEQKQSIIASELERLTRLNGGVLQPQAVVAEARKTDSPLHDSFDWDDTEAAEKWRLHQARQMIRVLVRYQPVANGKEVPVRVFVSLTPDRKEDGGGYRLAEAVFSDDEMRSQLLVDARRDLVRFKEKYSALAELAKVFEAIDNVQEELPISA